MARVFVGIGSNVGSRETHVALARRMLGELPQTQLRGFSPIYETAPVGPAPMGAFLNAAAELGTTLSPEELLSHLRLIEQAAGREPEDQRAKWGPRTLDLDILLYDQRIINTPRLIVPHPMMHQRWFVLKPLADLAADVTHPVLEKTIAALLKYVEDHAE